MIEVAIRSLLTNESTITDYVSTRIYAGNLPQNPTLPALLYFKVSDPGAEVHHGGGVQIYSPVFQISIYSRTYLEAKNIENALKAFLHGYSGTVSGVQISTIQFYSSQEFSDPTKTPEEHHIPMEFLFRYK